MQIPFSPPYIDQDVIDAVTATLQSGWITTGPKCRELEAATADYAQVSYALAVNSATSGMMLVLHWFGVTRGDEVIIPAYTYAATALAVLHIGAKPVMVDSGPDFTIDPEQLRNAITEKTKAVITVDYGGWPCDYTAIRDIVTNSAKFIPSTPAQAQLGRMLILSDAAHALGAVYKGKPVSAWADMTVYSLHAVKNITSAEGGMICINMPAPFNNADVCAILRLWSLNGQTKDAFTKLQAGEWKYDIVYPGFKMNMPDLLAALALAQLRKYPGQLLPERRRVVAYYNDAFAPEEWAICPPFNREGCASSCHIYPLRIKGFTEDQRNGVIKALKERGVTVNVHFIPLPMLTVFRERGYDINSYPVSYSLYCNEISLPVYPQLTDEQCRYVADAIKQSVEHIK